jgi:hypothetical protein
MDRMDRMDRIVLIAARTLMLLDWGIVKNKGG